jgi:hypothetical protein
LTIKIPIEIKKNIQVNHKIVFPIVYFLKKTGFKKYELTNITGRITMKYIVSALSLSRKFKLYKPKGLNNRRKMKLKIVIPYM